MQVAISGRSIWILLFNCLHLWGSLFASASSAALPAARIFSSVSNSVVCQAPEGQKGSVFILYNSTTEVDRIEFQTAAGEAHFTVTFPAGNSLFCCCYQNKYGVYSTFSPYLQLEQDDGVPSTFPAPVLSVEPSGGVVDLGDRLTFRCSVPSPAPQSLLRSSSASLQVSYLLMRASVAASSMTQPRAMQVSNSETQPGVFILGPVTGGEDGEYTCLYQVVRNAGLVNSSVSPAVQVIVKDLPPTPVLSLQQLTPVWHFLCMGSPAYPGAVFYLYLEGDDAPIFSQRAHVLNHQVTFQVPVQDSPVALYRCQYSVLLRDRWSSSAQSPPLAVSRGATPAATAGIDWPLVLGSFSASVLFLCALAVVVVVIRRHVNAKAEEKRKRQESQFWTHLHAEEHSVDLTPRCSRYVSQEWSSGETSTGSASRSPLWNSTFTSPSF
ncbi:uncharacterized protein LOC128754558 isoform X1 [Synchiropus splendidus]|uniref:uncharacterized protein LOC128754558 isoform X1 n=1 Tax=Synchiropus splendidus TaxID=270530 RepID=UPI00237ECAE3|nr:uncharacterized protein LOC128754558 isoform X1 [Synchiropus splendidus]